LKKVAFGRAEEYWNRPEPSTQVWTDKGPNLLHGVLRGHPFTMRYSAFMQPRVDLLCDLVDIVGLGSQARYLLGDLSRLPRPVEAWMVRYQLRNNPQVEKLWR
jgi:hypothetical protein